MPPPTTFRFLPGWLNRKCPTLKWQSTANRPVVLPERRGHAPALRALHSLFLHYCTHLSIFSPIIAYFSLRHKKNFFSV